MYQETYDIAIVGCGPAGLSAAVNASIRRKSVVLLGGELCAPKLQKSPLVTNYLGLPEIPGEELRDKFLGHVNSLGVPIHHVRVDEVSKSNGEGFTITAKEKVYSAKSVILATGVTVSRLIEGEQKYVGKGVGYCATCDGPLYRGRDVAVISHTREGVEEANFLVDFCRKVYFIPGSKDLGDGLKPAVKVIAQKPLAITGNGFVSGLRLEDRELKVEGIFIFRETHLPDRLVPGLTVENNHILVDRNFSTNVRGIFAAGDCTGKPYQLSKAVGEGAVAALNTTQYLDQLH